MRLLKTLTNGIKIYKHEDEYIVKHPTNPDADYFTGDWQDADQTAQLMDKSHETSPV